MPTRSALYTNSPHRTNRLYAEANGRLDHQRRVATRNNMLTRAYQKMMKKKGISPAPVINSARAREELVKVAHRKTLKHMAKQEGVRTFMRSKKRIRTDLMGRGRNG